MTETVTTLEAAKNPDTLSVASKKVGEFFMGHLNKTAPGNKQIALEDVKDFIQKALAMVEESEARPESERYNDTDDVLQLLHEQISGPFIDASYDSLPTFTPYRNLDQLEEGSAVAGADVTPRNRTE